MSSPTLALDQTLVNTVNTRASDDIPVVKVNVYNEWDPLEEIIIGDPAYAGWPTHDDGFLAIVNAAAQSDATIFHGASFLNKFPDKIIEETLEDLSVFSNELKKLGIIVRRPEPINFKSEFNTLDWEANHFFSYCPRDIMLAIGDMIIETPNVFRSRYFETFSYKKILIDYMKSGAKWIAAPKPRLLNETYNTSDKSKLALNNVEPVFDAANILRAGRDLFYQVSDSGNELGCQWLQSVLGDKYRVHPCRNLYSSIHIDTTISLLKPGLALINPARVSENNLPALLKKWKIIAAPTMIEKKYSDLQPMSSPWIGMNLLMISPELACCRYQPSALN